MINRRYLSTADTCSAFPKQNGLDLPLSRKIQPGKTTDSKPVKPEILSVA
jgi:hypothetical protein